METFGRYTLLRKLATGGMAEVWLARQTGPERFEKKLVIKRILPKFAGDVEFQEMFLNEARIAAQFSHPNVVQIYDLGEVAGAYYLAMEFVHGQDLGRIIKQARGINHLIPPQVALRIIALSCEGLHYAHTRTDDAGQPLKVIHRDISPANILVGFDGSVKVVDFGIAKAVNSASMTKSGFIKGKLSYMAPEQATSKTIDHRVDIFALGLTLYEALTGTRPLKKGNDAATFRAALECKIPPLTQVARWLPHELEPIVMRALAKNRDERYANAREFGIALDQFLVAQRRVAGAVQISEMMHGLFADVPSLPSALTGSLPPSPPAVQVYSAPEPPPPARLPPPPPHPSPATPTAPLVVAFLSPRGSAPRRPDPADPWAPGTSIGEGGHYVILRKLGEGVMSEVYLCAARGLDSDDKSVAIKKPHHDLQGDAGFVEALIRGARAASELNHRNVVRIHDFGKHEGTPYFAMEYVRGRPLGDVLERTQGLRQPMPPVLVARIGEEVARALSYAHQRDVVHRNLSPSNVLLSFDGSVKVTDFGGATSGASDEKLGYLSPEQARGGATDARVDLFSLGVVLWEALAGRRLFDGRSPGEIRSALESRAAVPPALINRAVPEALSELVMHALERDPRLRFQSAGELGRALRRVLASHAGPPEERDLARYLANLYGGEVGVEAAQPPPPEDETSPAISQDDLTVAALKPGDPGLSR